MWLPIATGSNGMQCSFCGQRFSNIVLNDRRGATTVEPQIELFRYCPSCGILNRERKEK